MAKQAINKTWIVLGAVILVLLIITGIIWGSYNNLVRLNQNADKTWADVQAQYQRRIDLIPNLVNVVESYAGFEKQTLTQITELRTQWQRASTVDQQVRTSNQIESALSKLLLIAENYPDLKASTNFIALQDSLAETENMISVARTRFNAAVRDYNSAVQVFPSNIIANWFGFTEKSYFEAAKGAEEAPEVEITIG